jgi:hypothetical protein
MDSFQYHFILELVAAYKDAAESERRAEQKAAAMKGNG